ncbi:hypothetical protein APT56_05930 [Achromobacter denitrificans]|nr:hypothetical protein APT56_05930 [Achromobacter denitrificans]
MAYQVDRCSNASAQARCTLIWKRSCIQAASSRRLAAFRLFSHHLLQDLLVQRQISHDAPQACVLVLELFELTQFTHPEIGVFLLPRVESRLRHSELPTHVDHWRTAICQSQRIGDLLFGKSRPFHGFSSPHSGR